jgi:Putative peptidoglycan binding domain
MRCNIIYTLDALSACIEKAGVWGVRSPYMNLMRFLKSVSLTALALCSVALPASAAIGFGIGLGVPLFMPPPYPDYCAPRPGYYQPAPVVVGREVGINTVSDAQRALGRRGYYHGMVDGEFGPQTFNAVREWQNAHGLPITGRLDGRTLRSLGLR